jgi:hypothetical protein
MILDSYLALKGIAPIEMGRAIGLEWPPGARRYLQHLKNGKPNHHYRPPAHKIQLKIKAWTKGQVTPNDWPGKPAAAETYQMGIYTRCQTKKAINRANQSARVDPSL